MVYSTALRRVSFLLAVYVASLPGSVKAADTAASARNAVIEHRILDSARFLASDELKGRGVGTDGIEEAADFLVEQLSELGLRPESSSQLSQEFTIATEAALDDKMSNQLVFISPTDEEREDAVELTLEIEKDFMPLAIGGSGTFEGPMVFAGYGITSDQPHYDDYAQLDVKGKVVVLLRKEPQQDDASSPFNGRRPSSHAYFETKVDNARKRGAKAVIIVNDSHGTLQDARAEMRRVVKSVDNSPGMETLFTKENASPERWLQYVNQMAERAEIPSREHTLLQRQLDPLIGFQGAGAATEPFDMPVYFCRRSFIADIIKKSQGVELAEIERSIDKSLRPRSIELSPWRAQGKVNIVSREVRARNIVGVWEGEGGLRHETVIVGAHYDHIGMGGSGSLSPWTVAIHNGADDNASGTVALVEIARSLMKRDISPRRRVVFIAFSGEERGLLGSRHYVENPVFPLESTAAMVNLDMVGRLNDDRLTIYGTGTATMFDQLLERVNKTHGFELIRSRRGYGPSDHASFHRKSIPAVHFFTGLHSDYHRPSDDYDKLNVAGIRRVADFVADLVAELAQEPRRPQFVDTRRRGSRDDAFLGITPDSTAAGNGCRLATVIDGSPAEKHGLQPGDLLLQFGNRKVGSFADLLDAVRSQEPGDTVAVRLHRDGDELTLNVELGGR